MIVTGIKLVNAKINRNGKTKEYISIENANGILLVDEELFVISFDKKEDIEEYIVVEELAKMFKQ